MKTNTVVFDSNGFLALRGCVFNPRGGNMVLPSSSQDYQCKRVVDIRTMINSHGAPRIFDAYFAKRIHSFVLDKEPKANQDKSLVVLAIYGEICLKTNQSDSVVFKKEVNKPKNSEKLVVYILTIKSDKEFAFELVDENHANEPKSCFLKYNKVTHLIDVVDLSDENHRRIKQPVTIRKWILRQISNATYNYFHPFSKWRS